MTTTSRPSLDQPLGPLDGQLGRQHVVGRRLVEGGRDDLAADRAAQVGDLFRALADQHEHEVHVRVAAAIACAIAFSTVVLPALGGETMRPRCPLPMGATRSMIRAVGEGSPSSRRNRWLG